MNVAKVILHAHSVQHARPPEPALPEKSAFERNVSDPWKGPPSLGAEVHVRSRTAPGTEPPCTASSVSQEQPRAQNGAARPGQAVSPRPRDGWWGSFRRPPLIRLCCQGFATWFTFCSFLKTRKEEQAL